MMCWNRNDRNWLWTKSQSCTRLVTKNDCGRCLHANRFLAIFPSTASRHENRRCIGKEIIRKAEIFCKISSKRGLQIYLVGEVPARSAKAFQNSRGTILIISKSCSILLYCDTRQRRASLRQFDGLQNFGVCLEYSK